MVLLTTALFSTPTWAADDGDYDSDADTEDTTIVALVSATYEIHDASGGIVYSYAGDPDAPVIVCYYYAPAVDGGLTGPDLEAGPVWPPVEGEPYFIYCYEGTVWVSGMPVVYDPADPLGPVAADERARALALEAIELPAPTIALSPPAGTPQLVGKPSWFAVDTPWVPVVASATLGGVTSTVTATPVSTGWDPDDGGDLLTCDGPGQRWYEGAPDEPPCGHTYTASGDYTLTTTITWDVEWAATTGGGGPLGTLTTTQAQPVTAREVQAVIT